MVMAWGRGAAAACCLIIMGTTASHAATPSALPAQLEEALRLSGAGRYAEAETLYRNLLATHPAPGIRRNIEQALSALETLQHGAPETASAVPADVAAPVAIPVIQSAPAISPAPVLSPAPMAHLSVEKDISIEKDPFVEKDPALTAIPTIPMNPHMRMMTAAPLPVRLEKAVRLAEEGHYPEAAEVYREILAGNPPPGIRAHAARALASLEKLSPQKEPVPVPGVEPDPRNMTDMDALFAYAQRSQMAGNTKEAEQAYLRMLELDPSLDRVRLDLALLYNQQGDYSKARPLLEHVLAGNPPATVETRAKAMLAEAKNPFSTLRHYGFEGSLSTGYNYDSNANAGSSTDAISLFDTTIDLPDGSQAQDDGQAFAIGGLTHTYNFKPDPQHPNVATRWYSTATAYKSRQISLDELDLVVLSGRTGPIIELGDYGTTLGLALGYNYVKLAGEHYLSVFSGESDVKYALTPTIALTGSAAVEDRAFINSPTLTAQKDRSGNAYQATVGINYTPTQEDAVTGQLIVRQEDAQVDYFTDTQYGASTAYTHAFPYNVFSNVSAGYRESRYDGPDPLISATTRLDKEATAGVVVGKMFEHNILATLGYQYRNVDSNIQNYNYDNHRILSSVGVRF